MPFCDGKHSRRGWDHVTYGAFSTRGVREVNEADPKKRGHA